MAATVEAPPQPYAISQIAIVVWDLEHGLERYHRALGWGPWNIYRHEAPSLHHTTLGGEAVEYLMVGAEGAGGPVGVELLQPLEGPSIYREWLEQRGEGLHHIACMKHTPEESDAVKQRFTDAGAAP